MRWFMRGSQGRSQPAPRASLGIALRAFLDHGAKLRSLKKSQPRARGARSGPIQGRPPARVAEDQSAQGLLAKPRLEAKLVPAKPPALVPPAAAPIPAQTVQPLPTQAQTGAPRQ